MMLKARFSRFSHVGILYPLTVIWTVKKNCMLFSIYQTIGSKIQCYTKIQRIHKNTVCEKKWCRVISKNVYFYRLNVKRMMHALERKRESRSFENTFLFYLAGSEFPSSHFFPIRTCTTPAIIHRTISRLKPPTHTQAT